ncbi:ESF1 homolog [Pollicipes pollicipes]|uniref:ESF1 homolog n=1 Tax=Pollicipes pollicipes TaxID=41117 RepID=UPI001884E073|nr:ESF1 homolog [Pollicipes pollicipes]XP_037081966.1 ESF1 homolog [Pollicipes pollicipes]XP_037081974.1 ESF1 homolog [Pollicipes pollicipes]
MDLAVDYARGGGRLQEDSSSDDESEPEQVEVEHDWAELDRDAPRIDDSETTARLAVCNMDWDRIKAQDLMVLLSSFAPPSGVIREVAIYPSEFGKKRMAEEEERGPSELFGDREEEEEEDKDEDDSSDDERKADPETAERDRMEFVRRYQLSRLRYFYAVVSCDSRQTAGALYDQCEGLEFESSASRVDLRFIPDGMEFDEEPRERCSAVPEAGRYRPSTFVTTALQQRLVRFTWDETDADRQETVRRAAQAGDIEDADIRAYLADSSDDEQPDEDEEEEEEKVELDRPEDEKARIAKYRALLADADDQDRKEEGDVEMEITWGVGIKEKTEEIVKKKEQQKDQTPWEKYIDKQKAKKKAKSAAQKETATAPSDDSDSDSDSDIPSDLADDPFFKEELDARRKDAPKQTKKVGKGKQSAASEEDQGDKDQLALLTMDDGEDDGRRHFNFKQIVKDETTSGKKKKWKKKRKPAEEQKPADDFEVDVADPRFSQLYDSAEFNVDPSDARFKRTAGMERLVGEKQRRLASGETRQPVSDGSAPKKARLLRPAEPDTEREAPDELSALVNTIKAKAKHAKRNKAKSGR